MTSYSERRLISQKVTRSPLLTLSSDVGGEGKKRGGNRGAKNVKPFVILLGWVGMRV